jgi:hypothetical protein
MALFERMRVSTGAGVAQQTARPPDIEDQMEKRGSRIEVFVLSFILSACKSSA